MVCTRIDFTDIVWIGDSRSKVLPLSKVCEIVLAGNCGGDHYASSAYRYIVLTVLDQASEQDSLLGHVVIELDNLDVDNGFRGNFQLSDMVRYLSRGHRVISHFNNLECFRNSRNLSPMSKVGDVELGFGFHCIFIGKGKYNNFVILMVYINK